MYGDLVNLTWGQELREQGNSRKGWKTLINKPSLSIIRTVGAFYAWFWSLIGFSHSCIHNSLSGYSFFCFSKAILGSMMILNVKRKGNDDFSNSQDPFVY